MALLRVCQGYDQGYTGSRNIDHFCFLLFDRSAVTAAVFRVLYDFLQRLFHFAVSGFHPLLSLPVHCVHDVPAQLCSARLKVVGECLQLWSFYHFPVVKMSS